MFHLYYKYATFFTKKSIKSAYLPILLTASQKKKENALLSKAFKAFRPSVSKAHDREAYKASIARHPQFTTQLPFLFYKSL